MRPSDKILQLYKLMLKLQNPYILLTVTLLILPSLSQSCAASQYFNGQRCAPCQQNCLCSSQYGCNSCMSGYTYDSTFKYCLPCPTATSAVNVGCAQCCYQIVNTAFVCSSCPALTSTYLLGGQCVRIQGCNSVTNDGMCQGCSNGYYLKNGICVSCHVSCSTCTDGTYCTACKGGYYSGANTDYATCAACSAGCTACTSATACTTCGTGYRLSGGGCLACPANCNQCTLSACTVCASGFALVGGNCNTPCSANSAGCLTCSTSTGSIVCTQCSSAYYLLSTGSCASCTISYPNSILCTATQPLQCSNDYSPVLASRYYLVSNRCIANTNKCKTMSNTNGQCSSCYFQPGSYYMLSNTGVCVQCLQTGCQTYNSVCECQACQNGYQYVNKQCVACQNLNCYVCQSNVQSCQQCALNYGLISSACIQCTQINCLNCDGDSTKCVTCQVGFYNSAGICYRCQASCTTCTSSTVCTGCNAGYYLLSSGRCKSLSNNCVQVSTSGTCTKCAYGYQILEGICVPCSTDLFNMGQCQRYCPSYYSLLKYQEKLWNLVTIIVGLLVFVSLQ